MIRAAIILALFATLPAFAAQPDRPDPLAEAFAACQGRFAAMQGANWTVPGLALPHEVAADRFSALLDSIAPVPAEAGTQAGPLHRIRMRARSEQAQILAVARFAADPRQAHRAGRMLADRLRACATMLPD